MKIGNSMKAKVNGGEFVSYLKSTVFTGEIRKSKVNLRERCQVYFFIFEGISCESIGTPSYLAAMDS